jgi:hypothetical protein
LPRDAKELPQSSEEIGLEEWVGDWTEGKRYKLYLGYLSSANNHRKDFQLGYGLRIFASYRFIMEKQAGCHMLHFIM